MPPELLLQAVIKRLKKVGRLARGLAPDFDAEVIHDLRTGIKKLRAYLRLADTAGDDRFSRLPKKFRKVYGAAGSIRDAQMQLQSLVTDDDKKAPGFALWLAGRIATGQQHWEAVYRPKRIRRLREQVMGFSLPQLEISTLTGFFQQRIEIICTTGTADDPDDEALHEVRKTVKDLLYVADWCEKHWPEGYAAITPFRLPDLKPLSDAAGKYNDGFVGLTFLRTYLADAGATADTDPERELLLRWQRQHDAEKTLLLSSIRDYCSKAKV